ncbi:MAG TPA: oxygenase MpaB family protein [Microthrixaceae bacterium]|nr:oxygenase MpaB family protein [Microthrixaceae bacterium]
MGSPADGSLYGADSWTWKINSRWMVLIGGQRAAIMQIADPKVAAGVADHSSYRTDPLGRLERTMDAMMIIGFGTPERRAQVLADLDRLHAGVKGRTEEGAPYSALDPRLMYWVLATLLDTTLLVDKRYVGHLRERDRERFFDESRAVSAAFGIAEKYVPENLREFREYMDERAESLRPSAVSREIAQSLLQPGIRWVPDTAFVPLDWITLEMLPSPLRRRLHLGALTPVQLAAVRGARRVSRTAMPMVPGPLTRNPFTTRALRRAA